jgi:hypothetical protein
MGATMVNLIEQGMRFLILTLDHLGLILRQLQQQRKGYQEPTAVTGKHAQSPTHFVVRVSTFALMELGRKCFVMMGSNLIQTHFGAKTLQLSSVELGMDGLAPLIVEYSHAL